MKRSSSKQKGKTLFREVQHLDLVDGLIAVLRHVRVEQRADEQDLLGLDLDIRRLSLRASQRLVNHDARVRQRSALALHGKERCGGGGRQGKRDRGSPYFGCGE